MCVYIYNSDLDLIYVLASLENLSMIFIIIVHQDLDVIFLRSIFVICAVQSVCLYLLSISYELEGM